jgi:antitoxin YefM
MRQIPVEEFQSSMKSAVEQVIEDHTPLRVTGHSGEDFVVVSAEDWEREQETLYVLQNRSLIEQIQRSLETHREGKGYIPRPEELDALDRV